MFFISIFMNMFKSLFRLKFFYSQCNFKSVSLYSFLLFIVYVNNEFEQNSHF